MKWVLIWVLHGYGTNAYAFNSKARCEQAAEILRKQPVYGPNAAVAFCTPDEAAPEAQP